MLVQKKYGPMMLRADPPYWWAGMENKELELLVHGQNLEGCTVQLTHGPKETVLVEAIPAANKEYIYLKLIVGKHAGPCHFTFTNAKGKSTELNYEIKQREVAHARGLSPADLIYLVFPDRFSNGFTGNDAVATMQEPICDRSALKGRHGGDLLGIINHLDYIEQLGATAVWLNPVLENDQPRDSYHGYAFTDHYMVDKRLGTNYNYRNLCDSLHKRNMKVVWDVVYNHWGNEHYLHKNLPDSNWVHWFPQFTRTSYRAETLMDPYASNFDKNIMSNAWFDHHMPDLNQQDAHLAAYLIQNSIWWIEDAGIDAFRIDTYAYPDQLFMKQLNEAILKEYPDFFLFGETWVQGPQVQSWFTTGNGLNKQFDSGLHGVTDFQLYYAITKGLNENFGWEEGFRRIELTLTQDLLYKDAYMNVTHLDNHDLGRFYSMVGEDYNKWKMGMAMLYTLRGIPCIYYGTELLMTGHTNPDALVRQDFPGGWPTDTLNKFLVLDRTTQEQEAFEFCSKLGNWRKTNAWFGRSLLTQFVPENNTYVYFRHDAGHTLMCIYNGNETAFDLDLSRFAECIKGAAVASDILSGEQHVLGTTLKLAPKSVMLLELD
ncbi:MAG: alpha-amylase family glycosyl hydrolase [Flavobacteriales bacterium]